MQFAWHRHHPQRGASWLGRQVETPCGLGICARLCGCECMCGWVCGCGMLAITHSTSSNFVGSAPHLPLMPTSSLMPSCRLYPCRRHGKIGGTTQASALPAPTSLHGTAYWALDRHTVGTRPWWCKVTQWRTFCAHPLLLLLLLLLPSPGPGQDPAGHLAAVDDAARRPRIAGRQAARAPRAYRVPHQPGRQLGQRVHQVAQGRWAQRTAAASSRVGHSKGLGLGVPGRAREGAEHTCRHGWCQCRRSAAASLGLSALRCWPGREGVGLLLRNH